jgi:hypothetical protein
LHVVAGCGAAAAVSVDDMCSPSEEFAHVTTTKKKNANTFHCIYALPGPLSGFSFVQSWWTSFFNMFFSGATKAEAGSSKLSSISGRLAYAYCS